jgi:hypothetical protein
MSMTSMTQPDERVRPSPWWYLAVVVLWIGSLAVFVIAIRPIITIFGAGVDQVVNNQSVDVPSDGLTVYSSVRPANATCTLQGGAGSTVRLEPFDQNGSSSFTFTFDDGTEVRPVASTPDGLAAGTYELSCQVPPRAVLATGERLDFDSFAVRLVVGLIGSIVAGIAGLIILIVLLVRRHNSKQRIRQAQAAAAYGYGGYPGYPPGGYPQSGYAQPGQPSPGGSPYGPPYGAPPPSPASAPAPPASPTWPPAAPQPGSSEGADSTPPEDRR